ncbi:acetyl-CoA carboxylase carboxyltransferase subunit alpha [Parvivirga hydrogeniphila]|uniref:acetyl-CoA carboxylase carboxyltransferase subunit alpha n=1 Tax=Parvivirga hydrogeniphila TaxID=2939460 RepID=UPI002B268315|nr:acetyl-CoA carboxylase carboxyltransferase subunit alpha [Parvivirga hydrogeniphila]
MAAIRYVMEFERPIVELEQQLEDLKRLDVSGQPGLADEIAQLESEIQMLKEALYSALTPWERVQIARHPERPKTQDYVEMLFSDVVELRGDRAYGDDEAMFAGLATIDGVRCVVLGHRKGKTTNENIRRNFGSPHPEGFRKAKRAMLLAEKFHLPVVSFLDTAGAYPGIEAEERGQAWAIAECLETLAGLATPVVVVGIGEGGSGGALAIGFGDRMIMLENAYYSVISPEMCSLILFKDPQHAAETASALRLTAADLVELGIADEIVEEPLGGAHRDPALVFARVEDAIVRSLRDLASVPVPELVTRRQERLAAIGRAAVRE